MGLFDRPPHERGFKRGRMISEPKGGNQPLKIYLTKGRRRKKAPSSEA